MQPCDRNHDTSAQEITRARYSKSMKFEDPTVGYSGVDVYAINLRLIKVKVDRQTHNEAVKNLALLQALFNTNWKVHSVEQSGPAEVTARCELARDSSLLGCRRGGLLPTPANWDNEYLHVIVVMGRWTMTLEMWLLPWRPRLTITGRTFFGADPDSGLILSHLDIWDGIQNNRAFSVEAVQHLLRMFLQVRHDTGMSLGERVAA